MISAIIQFDQSVVVAWNNFLSTHRLFDVIVEAIAVYGIYLIPVIWVVWWLLAGKKQREDLLSAMLAGIVAWQVLGTAIKLFVTRQRPDEVLPIKELLFRRPDNSFPSDHAAFLGGIAFFFLFNGQKKNGWIFLIYGVLIGLARIATAVHYPSDIVIGLVDGAFVAWVVTLFHGRLSATAWDYLISLARKLHLA